LCLSYSRGIWNGIREDKVMNCAYNVRCSIWVIAELIWSTPHKLSATYNYKTDSSHYFTSSINIVATYSFCS
jgi:hypothetical protein